MNFGEKLRALRKSKGLTQKELADILGVSASLVGQYETNMRHPKIGTIEKFASALGVSTDLLADNNATPLKELVDNCGSLHDALVSLYPDKFRTHLTHVPAWCKESQSFVEDLYKELEATSPVNRLDLLARKIDELNPTELEFLIAERLYYYEESERKLLDIILNALPDNYRLKIENLKLVLIAMYNTKYNRLKF